MYVPGKLQHNSKVMVNIGTGYYIEKVSACAIVIMCDAVKLLECKRSWGVFPA